MKIIQRQQKWIVLLTVLIIFFFLPNFFAGKYILDKPENSDLAYQWYPYFHFLKDSYIIHKTFPLWNPYDLCGIPFLAFFHTSSLYPLKWIELFFNFGRGVSISIFIHFLIAGLGMYFLFRELNFQPLSCIILSLSYLFSGFYFTNLNFFPSFYTASWLGWIFFFFLKFIKSSYFIYALGLIISFLFAVFAGDIEILNFFLLGIVLFFLFSWKNFSISFKTLPVIFIFFIIGFLFCLPLLLPGLELLIHSIRSPLAETKIQISFSIKQILQLLIVILFSFIYPIPFKEFKYQPLFGINHFYLGIISVFAFIIGLKKSSFSKKISWILVIFSIYFIFSLNPLFHKAISWIPILGQSIVPYRLLPFFEIIFLIIAGYGMEYIFSLKKVHLNYKFYIICIGYFLLALSLSLIFKKDFPFGGFELRLFIGILPVIFCFTYQRFPLKTIFFVLLAFDIYFWSLLHLPRSDGKNFRLHPYLISSLKNSDPIFRYFIFNTAPLDPQLPFSAGMILKADTIDSWIRVPLYKYAQFLNLIFPQCFKKQNGKITFYDQLSIRFLKNISSNKSYLFNLLNVRLFISRFEWENWKQTPLNLKLISKQPLFLYENLSALPRAFFVKKIRYFPDNRAIFNFIKNKTFDYKNEILLKREKNIISLTNNSVNIRNGKIFLKRINPSYLLINLYTPADCWLFISETYFPGWKAELDKKEIKIYEADYIFRAIFVPKGRHQLKLIYKPISFVVGLYFSLASVMFLLIVSVLVIFMKNQSKLKI